MDFAKLLAKIDSIESKKNLNEGWDDMMKSVQDREKENGTGKFDKKVISTGTVYSKKADKDQDEESDEVKKSKKRVKESEQKVDEDDVEEGNEFSGNRQDAIDAGKSSFEVDGKKYPVKEGAKPDFLDVDKDGDKEEPMKKALKDKEEGNDDKEKVDEAAAPGQEDWIKSNKERFVKQYGKKKGLEVLYTTAWKRSKQKDESKQIEESWDQAMAQQQDNSGMNINANMDTRTGQQSLTVTAQGSAANQLAQILTLSGIMGGSSVVGDEVEAEVAEEYANEPNPVVQSADAQFHQGNDLHREKGMHTSSYRQGDNPMAMAEDATIDAIEQRLMEQLEQIKVR